MSARLALAATAVVAAFAALALLLIPAPGSNAPHAPLTPAAPAAHVTHAGGTAVSSTITDRTFLTALAPDTDLDPATADRLTQTASLVCEGMTANVPLTVIESTLAARQSFTPAEAHRFVEVAATVRCYPRA
jgi:hypothetical protein